MYTLPHVDIYRKSTHPPPVDNFSFPKMPHMRYDYRMSKKHSRASRRRMLAIPKKKRSEIMSAVAKARWSKVGVADRRQLALKLVAKRRKNSSVQ